MHGSGMFVVNPPWTLAQTLAQNLPVLRDALGRDDAAGFAVQSGTAKAAR